MAQNAMYQAAAMKAKLASTGHMANKVTAK